jgi:hypothetical protein
MAAVSYAAMPAKRPPEPWVIHHTQYSTARRRAGVNRTGDGPRSSFSATVAHSCALSTENVEMGPYPKRVTPAQSWPTTRSQSGSFEEKSVSRSSLRKRWNSTRRSSLSLSRLPPSSFTIFTRTCSSSWIPSGL